MPSKSKTKGSGFEREVATHLSLIYNESFVRVPNSGAFVGGMNNVRKSFLSEEQIRGFKGDIIPGPSFPLLVFECKFYADFPFHQLLQNTDVLILDDWINQTIDCMDEGDLGLLCMKFNRKGRYVAYEDKFKFNTTRSINYKNWLITEYDSFWEYNFEQVKTYSQLTETTS
jgi:hypothetical protein